MKNMDNATRASIAARKALSKAVVDQMIAVLKENPFYVTMTNRQFVALMNERGIKSTWGRTWTKESVRLPKRRAIAGYLGTLPK